MKSMHNKIKPLVSRNYYIWEKGGGGRSARLLKKNLSGYIKFTSCHPLAQSSDSTRTGQVVCAESTCSVWRSGCMNQKKDWNWTQPNWMQLDHWLQLLSFGVSISPAIVSQNEIFGLKGGPTPNNQIEVYDALIDYIQVTIPPSKP